VRLAAAMANLAAASTRAESPAAAPLSGTCSKRMAMGRSFWAMSTCDALGSRVPVPDLIVVLLAPAGEVSASLVVLLGAEGLDEHSQACWAASSAALGRPAATRARAKWYHALDS